MNQRAVGGRAEPDGVVGALREALNVAAQMRHVLGGEAHIRYGWPECPLPSCEKNRAVLSDSRAVAQAEREAIEAPWRVALNKYGTHVGDCPQKYGYRCHCGFAEALLTTDTGAEK